MKQTMARYIILLCLILTLTLGGCTEPSPTEAASTPTTQSTQSTQSTQQSEPPEPQWPGYVDPKTEYTYYYTEGRGRDWEEDILYFANSLLTKHPMMRNEKMLIELPNYKTDAANFYDAELRQEVIDRVNALILRVADMKNDQIIFELKAIVALFGDVHTRLEYYETGYFPISFMPIQEDGEWVYYVALIHRDHATLLYSKLAAINGYDLDTVISMMQPYIPCETPWSLVDDMRGGGYGREYLSSERILKAAGIMDWKDKDAVYTLITEDGQSYDVLLSYKDYYDGGVLVGQWFQYAYSFALKDVFTKDCWISEDLAEDTLYVRINSFSIQQSDAYLVLSAEIRQAYRNHGSFDKVIVDLRFNGGGFGWSGYEGLIDVLVDMECQAFYVLIDSGTYSQATIFAGELMNARGENALLVGTPCGEAAGFFAGIWGGEFVMPNYGIEFTIPTCYFQPFPAGEDNYVIPDILVYPTIEDYRDGVDTILTYVLNQ